ncbi:MAG: VWA domain-containing protein [Methanoregula sp.]|nr:VWA domain-containing protein [Methanoregula sp.]
MLVKRWVLVFFCLALLISSAAAIDLFPSTISSSNPGWLIANDGSDQSTITVYALATGTPPTPVSGANVIFSLDPASQDLGTISPLAPASVVTGADGKATAVFTTSKKSGTATIIATISFNDGTTTPVQVSTIQRIDHDTPQGATFENPAELPVGSITGVSVTLVDRWGNRIDNKNSAETIRLTMTDDGGAGLQDGENYVTQKTYSTDADGNVSAVLRISTAVRSNYIQMDPIGNIVVPPGTYIQGVAESKPYYIAQTPASPGSSLPADGLPESAVEIYYTVTDKYNNPITGASVYCDSTDGMSVIAPTNTWGRLRISFGPKDTIGVYTLKATPLENASAVCTGINTGTVGYCSQDIEYYNTDPVDLTFTGNPQSMTSLDVASSTRAVLQARVIDIKGNPVTGELVTFSLAASTYPGGPYIVTADPSLSTQLPVPVDGISGYATVEFSPGAFAIYGADGYNATATGQVVATASWTNKSGILITKDVTLVWKNYPYISTSSIADCGNSQVGDKISITIQLKGDGAALWPKPIDVVLLNDRSGSMLEGDPDRMVSAKAACSLFFSKLASVDKIGEISFGDTRWAQLAPTGSDGSWDWTNVYSSAYLAKTDDSKWDSLDCVGCKLPTWYPLVRIGGVYSLTSPHHQYIVSNYNDGVPRDYGAGVKYREDLSFGTHTQADVDAAMKSIVPAGSTPTREGIYRAVNMLPASTPGRVRAIILLTDGEYNTGNDPEALTSATPRFSAADLAETDSVITYAKNKDIKIYPVGLGVSSAYQTILERYATTTGGKYSNANDPGELEQIYTNIAGDLQETAGGETQVNLDFGTIKINDEYITKYMDYEYHEGYSTYINKFNITKDGVIHQIFSESRDDTAAWNARTMAFDVGTIKLNETWRATFQLNLTKAGSIDLFGLGSSAISFTDASTGITQTGFIPAMQCRVRASIVNTGFGSKTLRVDNLSFVEGANPDPNVWTIKWNTTYDGDKTVQEAILYRVTGDTQWKTVPGGLVFITTPVIEETTQQTIPTSDTALWPTGKCFDIQIVAGAEDANAAITNPITKCKALPGGTIFIKLE